MKNHNLLKQNLLDTPSLMRLILYSLLLYHKIYLVATLYHYDLFYY